MYASENFVVCGKMPVVLMLDEPKLFAVSAIEQFTATLLFVIERGKMRGCAFIKLVSLPAPTAPLVTFCTILTCFCIEN